MECSKSLFYHREVFVSLINSLTSQQKSAPCEARKALSARKTLIVKPKTLRLYNSLHQKTTFTKPKQLQTTKPCAEGSPKASLDRAVEAEAPNTRCPLGAHSEVHSAQATHTRGSPKALHAARSVSPFCGPPKYWPSTQPAQHPSAQHSCSRESPRTLPRRRRRDLLQRAPARRAHRRRGGGEGEAEIEMDGIDLVHCMCMCVCVTVRVHVRVHVHICACAWHVHVHVHMCVSRVHM